MCGICGGKSNVKLNIVQMTSSLRHRGPDFLDTINIENVYLGHTRLSILDLSHNANQPMTSSSGRYVITYNGEIYNYLNIRNDLSSLGVKFTTNSDTEVILEGFAIWGVSLFERLNGMFAFCIFDKHEHQLFVVRDRFGIKPLYYYNHNNNFIFGSEIKSLLSSDLIERNIDYEGLHQYLLFSTTLGSTTFYKKIKKILPGNYLIYNTRKDALSKEKYINHNYCTKSYDSIDDAIYNIQDLFINAIKKQLISDVPIGIFLSGGIDSSAITAIASKYYSGRLRTYSAGFDFDRGINELPNAKYISDHFSTDHTEFHITGRNIPSILENLNFFFDQPFGDSANIPLYLMSKEVANKDHQKVILQGDGGDELFAGYNHYFRLKNIKLFKSFSKFIIPFSSIIPKSSKYYRMLRSMQAVTLKNRELIPARLYSQELASEPPSELFKESCRIQIEDHDPYNYHRKLHKEFKSLDLLQEVLYTDVNAILPDQYLEKVDRATMANGIEIRVPFLDNDLANYVMSLPSSYKVVGREKKYLLKKSLHGLVPERILNGPKRGFSVPFKYWLRTSMKDYMYDMIKSCSCFDVRVEQLMSDHVNKKKDHGYILWKLLNLSVWLNKNKDIIL